MRRMKVHARLAIQFLVACAMVFQQAPVAAFAQQAAAAGNAEAAQPAEQQEGAAPGTEETQPAEATAAEDAQPLAANTSDGTPATAETNQWGKIGTCLWSIDSNGLLTIKPEDGSTEGTIGEKESYRFDSPWKSRKDEIHSVKFEGRIRIEYSLAGLFDGYRNLESIDFGNLDTSSVTDMSCMFLECSSLASLDLSSFDTSKVTDMSLMFRGCSSLASVDLSSFDTSSVTDMNWMFLECSSLASLDLSSFDTSKVTDMGGMFGGCSSLASLDLSSLDTSKVANMSQMFSGCSSLASLDLSSFDTSRVTNMEGMFGACSSLTSLDLSAFDTSSVTGMSGMFYGCWSLPSLDLSSFCTSRVTNMSNIFSDCASLTSLDLSPLDTSRVTSMEGMFSGCSSLTSLDLSPLDTPRVTSMHSMFLGCSSLASLDLSPLDTSSVTDMSFMFQECSSLASLNLSSLDTSRVTDMTQLFLYCSTLASLNLSSFDTSRVTSMNSMFSGCSSLTSLDLSSFDTSKVAKFSSIFNECGNLRQTAVPKDFKPKSELPQKYKGLPITWETADGTVLPTTGANAAGTYCVKTNIEASYFNVDTENCAYTGKAIEKRVEPAQDYSWLERGKDYSIGYEGNTDAGTATITIKGAGLLKGQLKYTFTIDKANPPYEAPKGVTAIRGKKLSDVELPKGFSWDNPDTIIDWRGKKEQTLTYTPEDTKNYKVATGIKVEVTATAGMVPLPTVDDLTFNGDVQAPVVDAPDVAVVKNEGGTSAGTYSVEIALSDPSHDTWEDGTKGNKTLEYRILPADIADTQAKPIAPLILENGAAEPEVSLTFNGKTLAKDTDFTVTYKDNSAPGTAMIIIEGTGNFTGSRTLYFQIAKGSIDDFDLIMRQKVFLYESDTVEPPVWVSTGDWTTPLRRGIDYTVSYENNDKVGTAKVIVTGRGEYTGTLEETFKIVDKVDLSRHCSSTFLKESNFLYTGTEIRPKAYVRLQSESFHEAFGDGGVHRSEDAPREGRDFTVRYENNVNPGTATVIVEGCGNYTGTLRQTFRIVRKADLSLNNAFAYLSFDGVVGESSYAYTDCGYACLSTGKPIEPNVTVQLQASGGTNPARITLTRGMDYKVSYSHNTHTGTAEVTVEGINGIQGSKTLTFQIVNKLSVKDLGISEQDFEQLEYELKPGFGAAPKLKPSKSFVEGTDYSLSYADCDKIGMGRVTITGHDRYTDSVTIEIPIVERLSHQQLSTCTLGEIEDQVYTGSPICPSVAVSDDDGNALDTTIDCDLEYRDNINAGEATITACRSRFCTSYDGIASTTFKILPADIAGAQVAEIEDVEYTGEEIESELELTFNGRKLEQGADFTVAYKDNIAPGTATVEIAGAGNFTGTASATFEIKPADIEVPAGLSRIAGTTRYETMDKLVGAGNFKIGGTAVLASGTNYPDALAASSLAGDRNAPILLTDPNSLSEETKARLRRINPQILFIVGGEAAVSSKVEKSVEELLGESCTVIRLAGQTRYDTSLHVASLNSGRSDTVIIATGGNYADALSISPYAYASGSPVLLCDSKSGLSADAIAAIGKGGYTKAVIVGGTAAVPRKVESQLRSAGAGKITRLAGSTRYETSAKIADFELSSGLGFTMDGLLLATGRNFPDALAAGPLAGRGPSPLLLVDPGESYACSYLGGHRNEISRATVVGGNAAIPDSDAQKIAQTLQIKMVR